MQKVTTVNLSGRACQLEESAYGQLQAYLDQATKQLDVNPDRSEILADIEQAIAEKCHRLIGPYKSVVTGDDMARVLAEMGPVVSDERAAGESAAPGSDAPADEAAGERGDRRRLYRLPEGKMVAGVCTGLAAYLGIDVAFLRIAYLLAFVFWFPWAVLLYFVPMVLIPEANTPEAAASARGEPFSARDVIDQAKRAGHDLTDQARRTRAAWRRERRRWHAGRRAPFAGPWPVPPGGVWAPAFAPIAGVLGLLWMALVGAAAVSIARTHGVFGWPLPAGMPVWIALLGLLVVAQIIVAPLQHAPMGPWGYRTPLLAWWNALIPLAMTGFVVWVLYQHMAAPDDFGDFIRQVPDALRALARELAGWLSSVAG